MCNRQSKVRSGVGHTDQLLEPRISSGATGDMRRNSGVSSAEHQYVQLVRTSSVSWLGGICVSIQRQSRGIEAAYSILQIFLHAVRIDASEQVIAAGRKLLDVEGDGIDE